MSYPDQHFRITWGGSLYGAPNSWQNNLHIVYPTWGGEYVPLTDEEFLTIVAPLLYWFKMGLNLSHNNITTDWLSISLISRTGGVLESLIMDFKTSKNITRSPLTALPSQVSLVLTMRAASGSTLASTGRIYLPAPSLEVQRDGKIKKRLADAVAETFAYTIEEINKALKWIWPGAYVALVSPQREGRFGKIVSVSCGDVLDTMQSRKKFLEELYTESYNIEEADWHPANFVDVNGGLDDIFGDIFSELLDQLADKDIKVSKKTPLKFKK